MLKRLIYLGLLFTSTIQFSFGNASRSWSIGLGYPKVLTDYSPLFKQGIHGKFPNISLYTKQGRNTFQTSYKISAGWSALRDLPNIYSLLPNTVLSRSTILLQFNRGYLISILPNFNFEHQLGLGISFNEDDIHTHYFMQESKSIITSDFPALNFVAGSEFNYDVSKAFAVYSGIYQHRRMISIKLNEVEKTHQINSLWGEIGLRYKFKKRNR